MVQTKSAALVAALATAAVAQPVELKSRSAFRVNQIATQNKRTLTGAEHIVKAAAKYGKLNNVPAHVKAAAASGQSGSVTATSYDGDDSYLCPVSVGGQTLNLDFDTGSADLWVFSTELPSSESSGHTLYNPSESGQEESGETWNISYGDGSGASGNVYADTVVVGSVTATSQAVEAATSVSSQFEQSTQNDGLLGLAFSSINTVSPNQATTFYDTVASSLAEQLFAVRLRKGTPGTYDFGFIDNSLYTGDISYVSVDNSQGFWGFTPDGYSVNGQSGSTTIGGAIADTGTTLLLLPDGVLSDYYGQVSGAQNDQSAGGYTFPCSSNLPDLVFSIGGGSFTVPGSYINFQSTGSGDTCFGGLQSSTSIGTNIFGDIFLKAQYVIFDQTTGSPRLGFATGA